MTRNHLENPWELEFDWLFPERMLLPPDLEKVEPIKKTDRGE